MSNVLQVRDDSGRDGANAYVFCIVRRKKKEKKVSQKILEAYTP
jgi:hypothetical protein